MSSNSIGIGLDKRGYQIHENIFLISWKIYVVGTH